MKLRLILTILIFLLKANAILAQQKTALIQTLFVSPSGNDSNKGLLTQPYRTIGKAISKAQGLKGKKVVIKLRGGTYYLDNTIILDAINLTCATLKIENYSGEKVVISAGRKLNLKWERFKDGIYQARVPDGATFERFYVNGEAQQMARYPNYDQKARFFNGTAADAITAERTKKWENPAGGYVHALHEYEWGSWDYKILGKDNRGELTLEGGWQNNRPSIMHPKYRFVENIMEELDFPGEWYLNKSNHILYYYPAKEIDLVKAKIEVSNLKNSIELKGSETRPVRNVELKGISFAHNERTFMQTKEPLLRSDWTIYRGGAVLFDGTENCKITDCSFTGLGGNAIMLSNYNKKDTISGCYVAHIGASAICFVGSTSAVRSPLFNYNQSMPYERIDKVPGPLNNNYPQNCVVTDNLFHHLGEIEKQATGVELSMSAAITVSHNSIYNTPRAGINIGDGTWGGHIIAYNDVFNTVQETGDHGAFNSWGRDRFWNPSRKYMDSIVKVHPELILLDAQKQTVIHNNRFRCDHGWDIDLDDGSSNYLIYNNVCLNGGLKLREGFNRIVENNIMVNNSFHPHVWFENSGDVFKYNIVSTAYAPIQIKYWGKEINNNFFISNEGLNKSKKLGNDQHSATGDPLFVSSATGNYKVAVGSPALKIGFKNFEMDQFGVKKESLKKITQRPIITPLVNATKLPELDFSPISFLGGQLKNVNGLGDRSAFGLPDENGVIILTADPNSLLAKSGLLPKDVIRTADGKVMTNFDDLLKVYQSSTNKDSIVIEFIRNQKLNRTLLRIK